MGLTGRFPKARVSIKMNEIAMVHRRGAAARPLKNACRAMVRAAAGAIAAADGAAEAAGRTGRFASRLQMDTSLLKFCILLKCFRF